MQHANSHTKIIATLGPASSTKEIIKKMILEGVDVFRLNFSHSSQNEYLRLVTIIHTLNQELGTHVSVLADLQGPKLRVGEIENNRIDLAQDDIVTFTTTECLGNKDHIYMSYQKFPQDVNVGEAILIDDGKIKLEVTETNNENRVKARVIYGGQLSSNKGVNLPDTKVSLPGLSETPEALLEIDAIIGLADGIMVARGDLGVEVPFDQVPLIQKSIVAKCIMHSKPVIIATQMMESMITNFRPTRAEANDVANAVFDGADALMLSGETAVGNYPVETITCMQRIIDFSEKGSNRKNTVERLQIPVDGFPTFLADSICYNASRLADQIEAKAIILFTHSGYTAIKMSSYRPQTNIYTFTNNKKLLKMLSLVWGIRPFYLNTSSSLDTAISQSIEVLTQENLLEKGDCVIHIGSTPLCEHGSTNMLKVSSI